ncbi:hypothetical protein [Laspinema olomoucense]|uniref:Uncharacterized protein n=1 Tax=Laspinema olomoucense D3b TaxID=2953688 RepID=A0ABT2N7L3_9CYAN|nr:MULTISPECIES: hypothetical protein [unclassified Laspinema]MCT7973583.1 hypothetical protein [Laspinema sp. D3d]MCT7978684.1 hypothetical protein [Laspinema sp. D3b]MCT7989372.1 hypothetical protein [Laspinema sp. D3a]
MFIIPKKYGDGLKVQLSPVLGLSSKEKVKSTKKTQFLSQNWKNHPTIANKPVSRDLFKFFLKIRSAAALGQAPQGDSKTIEIGKCLKAWSRTSISPRKFPHRIQLLPIGA